MNKARRDRRKARRAELGLGHAHPAVGSCSYCRPGDKNSPGLFLYDEAASFRPVTSQTLGDFQREMTVQRTRQGGKVSLTNQLRGLLAAGGDRRAVRRQLHDLDHDHQ